MTTTAKNIPASIGIIMDGNRRWAREKGLSSLEGHKAGAEKVEEVLSWAHEAGVENLGVYACSTENWNRTRQEVAYLMKLFQFMLGKKLPIFKKKGIRLRCIGERARFSKTLQKLMDSAERETRELKGPTLSLALSYGGRAEILAAVNRAVGAGKEVDEKSFAKYLWTQGIPDPDIIIRTGGEKRLSGFLPWQGVYSELFFTDTKWPAFSKKEFFDILHEFGQRKRNFGR